MVLLNGVKNYLLRHVKLSKGKRAKKLPFFLFFFLFESEIMNKNSWNILHGHIDVETHSPFHELSNELVYSLLLVT